MIPGIDILMLFCRKITNFLVLKKFKVCVVFDQVGAVQHFFSIMPRRSFKGIFELERSLVDLDGKTDCRPVLRF